MMSDENPPLDPNEVATRLIKAIRDEVWLYAYMSGRDWRRYSQLRNAIARQLCESEQDAEFRAILETNGAFIPSEEERKLRQAKILTEDPEFIRRIAELQRRADAE